MEKDYDQSFLDGITKRSLLTSAQERAYGDQLKAKRIAEQRIETALDCRHKRELQATIDQGNEARERMIEANLSLVLWVARRFEHKGLELMDLFQEGTLGLMKAADRFDSEKGVKFATYATWWIEQSIRRSLTNQAKLIRVPERIMLQRKRMQRIEREHYARFGVSPTKEMIAERMDIKPEQVAHLQRSGWQYLSLDQETDNLANTLPSAEPSPELVEEKGYQEETIRTLLASLTGQERRVIEYRYGFKDGRAYSYRAIADALNMSVRSASETEKGALRKLRVQVSNMKGDVI
ncbi:MAG: RNA polymerase sigma factor RpoD/SigA [Acholeplasmataceae bacterium]